MRREPWKVDGSAAYPATPVTANDHGQSLHDIPKISTVPEFGFGVSHISICECSFRNTQQIRTWMSVPLPPSLRHEPAICQPYYNLETHGVWFGDNEEQEFRIAAQTAIGPSLTSCHLFGLFSLGKIARRHMRIWEYFLLASCFYPQYSFPPFRLGLPGTLTYTVAQTALDMLMSCLNLLKEHRNLRYRSSLSAVICSTFYSPGAARHD